MSFIRAILYYFITATAMVIAGVPYVLIRGGLMGQSQECTKICVKFFQIMFKIFGIKLNIVGKENIPETNDYVIVTNHQSFLDINVIWPGITSASFIAKGELWHIPVFGWVLNHIGCIPVNHKDPRKNAGMGKLVSDRLSKGYTIAVFPEGHRSADGRMLKFQNGIFRMAKEQHFKILPITLIGTGDRLSKTRFSLTPGDVTIVVHPLQKPEDYADKPMNDFRDEMHDLIESALPYKKQEQDACKQAEAAADSAANKEA